MKFKGRIIFTYYYSNSPISDEQLAQQQSVIRTHIEGLANVFDLDYNLKPAVLHPFEKDGLKYHSLIDVFYLESPECSKHQKKILQDTFDRVAQFLYAKFLGMDCIFQKHPYKVEI